MHLDFSFRRVYRAIRLLTGAAQGVRHRGARVALDFGGMAELTAARSCGILQRLWGRDLRMWVRKGTVSRLSSSRGNNSHEGNQNVEPQLRDTLPVHDLGRIIALSRWNCTSVTFFRAERSAEVGFTNIWLVGKWEG